MSDIYESSNRLIPEFFVGNNNDADGGSYEYTGTLPSKTTGYEGQIDIPIKDFGIESSVIDVDVWMEVVESAGGGNNRYRYLKFPFTRYLSNGTVEDSGLSEVFYIASVEKGQDELYVGPATLRITYRNNVSATTHPRFFYKFSTRAVLAP